MSLIDDCFTSLRRNGARALIPFVTAGDPNLKVTAEVLQLLDRCGASLGEVGVPYSDPIADGPVIQASYQRALEKKIRLDDIFQMTRSLRGSIKMPLVTMVSYAIIHRRGIDAYLDAAIEAGISGAIVPDLLLEEADAIATRCQARDFNLIQLVTPTTPRERQLKIAERSSGFLYFVSVTGITGERRELAPQLLENVAWLRERTPLPICIGFGISQPEHVRQVAQVADGVIVGSALVRRIAALDNGSQTNQAGHRASHGSHESIGSIETYVREMIAALT
jgi:tryptophan synthase alpha chain